MKRFILVSALTALVSGCAFWEAAGPIIKTIADIALDACVASAAANEEDLAGMSAAEWCDVGKNFTPFMMAQQDAAETAGGELGFKRAPE